MFLLDANTCIYFLNGKSESIQRKVLSTPPVDIKIPSVVKAELLFGAEKSKMPERVLEKLEAFLQPFEVLAFHDGASFVYASIRKQTEERGTVVGPNDLLIAATAKFHEGILVTRNVGEFSQIDGLLLENWWES